MNWKTIAALSLAVFSIAIVCAFAEDSADADGGSAGTNVTWAYDSGTLTITATADGAVMTNWTAESNVPWYSDRASITSVVFNGSGTLTNIGAYAFSGCSHLSEIELPNTVTTVGSNAFSNSGITFIIFTSSSEVTINNGAFSGCNSLLYFAFHGNVVNSEGSVKFYNGTTEITAPADLKEHTFLRKTGETTKYEIKQEATEESYRITDEQDLSITFTVPYRNSITVNDGTSTIPSVKYTATMNSSNLMYTDLVIDHSYWTSLGDHTISVDTGYGVASQEVTVVDATHTVTLCYKNGSPNDTVIVSDDSVFSKPTPDPTWTGFTFDKWMKGDTEFDFSTHILEDITLDATWTINKPGVTGFATTEYSGANNYMSINTATPSEATFQWQKKVDDVWTDVSEATSSTYGIKNVSDSGAYRVKVFKTYGSIDYWATSDELTSTINKRTVTFVINATTECNQTYSGSAPEIDALLQTGFPSGEPETIHVKITLLGSNAGTYVYSTTATTGFYYTLSDWSDGTGDTDNYQVPPDSSHLTANNILINPASVELEISSSTTLTFDGNDTKEITVRTGINEEDLKIVATMYSVNAGTYEYAASAASGKYTLGTWTSGTGNISNYTATTAANPGDLTVSPLKLIINITNKSITYDASTRTLTYEDGTGVGGETIDITLTAHSCNAASYVYLEDTSTQDGKYIVSWSIRYPAVSANYDPEIGEADNFVIKQKAVTVTANDQTITYGGALTITGKAVLDGQIGGHELSSFVLTKKNDHVAYENNKVIPSDAVILSGSVDVTSNYSITYVDGDLTINKKAVTLNIPASSIPSYDGVTKSTDVTVTSSELVASEDLKITVTAYSVNAGMYQYSSTPSSGMYTVSEWKDGTTGKASDYNVTLGPTRGSFTINKKTITPAIPASEFEYNGGVNTDVEVSTGVLDEKLNVKLTAASKNCGTYTYSATETPGVGKYVAETSSTQSINLNNYTINGYTGGALTITPSTRALSIGYEFITYNGVLNYKTTVVSTGIGSETLGVTITAYSADVGIYEYATSAGEGKYTLSDWTNGTGLVTNYELNIGSTASFVIVGLSITVTAKDQTKEYGTGIDTGVSMIDQTGTMLSGHTITAVTLSKNIMHVGTGKITPSNVVIKDEDDNDVTDNYDIDYVDGIMNVVPAHISAVIPETECDYNGKTTLEIEVETGVLSEKIKAVVTLDSKNVGTYDESKYVVSSWKDHTGQASDYAVDSCTKNTITVTPVSVTMNIEHKDIVYDGACDRIFEKGTGVNGETLRIKVKTASANVGTYAYSTSLTQGTYTAGEWENGTGDISNYDITKGSDYQTIVVSAKAMTLTVTDQVKTYDGENMTYTILTGNITGMVSGDQLTGGVISTSDPDARVHTEYMDDWIFDSPLVTKNGITNYDVTYNVAFTINPRTISIKSMTATGIDGTFVGGFTCEKIQEIGEMGYVGEEVLSYDFTGSQSGIGTSQNKFTCSDSTGKVSNYNIKYQYGTLKVMSANDVSVDVKITSDTLTEQEQADLLASAKYNWNMQTVKPMNITTSKTEINASAQFIKSVLSDYSTPICISTSDGKMTLTKDAVAKALTGTSSFTAKMAYVAKDTGKYAVAYEVALIADGNEIHELGAGMDMSFYVDASKVFPINRTFKALNVDTGDRYDASYDAQTGEIACTVDHLSYYAVTMAENVGGPSFTGVIIVIVVSLVLAIAAGAVIFYLKKNYYI